MMETVIRNILYVGIASILLFSLFSCITEYVPKNVEQLGGMLVVESTVTSGETSVKLSYSLGILDDISTTPYINHAQVYVVCSDGTQSEAGEKLYNGVYRIDNGELDLSKQYKLKINVDGKTYESELLTPVNTPAIDSVFWLKNGPGAPVRLCVATHDPAGQQQFYRWAYEENWEVRANLVATYTKEGKEWVEHDFTTPNNIFNCWGRDTSRMFLLGSTEKLTDARISRKEIVEMQPSSDKLSILYHIQVQQMALRKEAYDYFYNLQKNTESTGGIFGSMPTELRGNVYCTSDPDEYVIGYVEVSLPVTAERYIPVLEGAYERPISFCEIEENPTEDLPEYMEVFDKAMGYIAYSTRDCFDCRMKYKATKKKPSWWPTDSL